MNKLNVRSAVICATGIVMLLSACAFGGGYGDGVDYYEPAGGVYGGWDSGYQVGPYHDHGHARVVNSGTHAYRSAPAARSAPSIPSGSRGSGGGRR